MKISAIVMFSLGTFLILENYSCKHDPIGIENLDTVCFSRDVLPIFQNSCAMTGCHSGGKRGFNATSYESIIKEVTPGNASKSKVYQAITSIYFNTMPPSPHTPLSKDQRTIIEVWINQGAKNTTCDSNSSPTPTSGGPQNNVDSTCFAQTIQPIFMSNCAVTGCHDPVTHQEGYDFSTYASLMSRTGSIVPFNPNASRVFNAINNNESDDRMPPPPRSKLSSADIDALSKWISQGALNSNCPSGTCDTLNPISFSQQVFPIIQKNCAGCHGSVSPNGNINLGDYNQIKYYSENGINGTPYLIGVLNSSAGFKSMPPYGKLDQCSIRTIELWINQGKINN